MSCGFLFLGEVLRTRPAPSRLPGAGAARVLATVWGEFDRSFSRARKLITSWSVKGFDKTCSFLRHR